MMIRNFGDGWPSLPVQKVASCHHLQEELVDLVIHEVHVDHVLVDIEVVHDQERHICHEHRCCQEAQRDRVAMQEHGLDMLAQVEHGQQNRKS